MLKSAKRASIVPSSPAGRLLRARSTGRLGGEEDAERGERDPTGGDREDTESGEGHSSANSGPSPDSRRDSTASSKEAAVPNDSPPIARAILSAALSHSRHGITNPFG
jgi:hypothetical protein